MNAAADLFLMNFGLFKIIPGAFQTFFFFYSILFFLTGETMVRIYRGFFFLI